MGHKHQKKKKKISTKVGHINSHIISITKNAGGQPKTKIIENRSL